MQPSPRCLIFFHLDPMPARPPPTMPPAWMSGPSLPAIRPPPMENATATSLQHSVRIASSPAGAANQICFLSEFCRCSCRDRRAQPCHSAGQCAHSLTLCCEPPQRSRNRTSDADAVQVGLDFGDAAASGQRRAPGHQAPRHCHKAVGRRQNLMPQGWLRSPPLTRAPIWDDRLQHHSESKDRSFRRLCACTL